MGRIKKKLLLYGVFPVSVVGGELVCNKEGISHYKPKLYGTWGILWKEEKEERTYREQAYRYCIDRWWKIGYFKAVYNNLRLRWFRKHNQKMANRFRKKFVMDFVQGLIKGSNKKNKNKK